MRCAGTAKTTGNQCRRGAIHGGTVCKKHGGAAPQVIKKAVERLKELEHPAIDRIAKTIAAEPILAKDDKGKTILVNGNPVVVESVSPAVALKAATSVLDYTGHKPVEKHEDVTPESEEAKLLKDIFTLEELKKIRERFTK